MKQIKVTSFGRCQSARLVTAGRYYQVVQARNPYGTHNLCVADVENGEVFRHGTIASLAFVESWMTKRTLRRVLKFVATKPRYLKAVRAAFEAE